MRDAPSSSLVPDWLLPHRDRLGVDSDATIARKLQMPFEVGLSAVSNVRANLGIVRAPHDPIRAIPDWLAPHLDRVGIDADATVAKAAGVSTGAVRNYRMLLGHGAAHPMRAGIEKLRAVLGTKPDDAVAAEHGLSRSQLRYHRRMLDAPAYIRPVGAPPTPSARPAVVRDAANLPDWLLPYVAQIGVLPDAEIARKTGKSREMIRIYRNSLRRNKAEIPEPDLSFLVDRLGVVPDATLSKESGVSLTRIRAARAERGIPKVKHGPKPVALERLAPLLSKLGTCPDRVLAAEAKVSVMTVVRARLKAGIEPYAGVRLPKGEGVRRLLSYHDKLGVWSDAEIARQADVHLSSVVQLRVRLGIAPAPRGTTKPLAMRKNDE